MLTLHNKLLCLIFNLEDFCLFSLTLNKVYGLKWKWFAMVFKGRHSETRLLPGEMHSQGKNIGYPTPSPMIYGPLLMYLAWDPLLGSENYSSCPSCLNKRI